jgi:hypothetical protein
MRSSFGFSFLLLRRAGASRRLGIGMYLLLAACGSSAEMADVKPGAMPAEGNFTGVYFSPQYGEMHLVQNGSAVVGKYKKDERSGSIQGDADGDLMRFEWKELKAMVSNRPQESIGHGYFRYMVDPANGDHVLKGRWGLDDSDMNGGEWNAYKSRKLEPDLEKFGDEPTSGGESSDEGESSGGDEGGGESESTGGDEGGGEEEGDDIF